MSLDNNQK